MFGKVGFRFFRIPLELNHTYNVFTLGAFVNMGLVV